MAELAASAPAQHSQPSRKGKRAWRKNVDLTEIQGGLDKTRDEIIQGGVVAEIASDELFTTDFVGEKQIRTAYVSRHKPLRVDAILAERSAIPAVSTHKRSANPSTAVIPQAKRHKKDGVTDKEYQRLRHIAYGGDSVHKDVVKTSDDASYDPWSAEFEAAANAPMPEHFSYVKPKKAKRAPESLKQKPISMAVDGREIKSVRKPAAEKSYNPTFEDWHGRLEREGAKEVDAEKERLEQAAKQQDMFDRQAAAQLEEDQARQYDSEWESEWEGIASENEGEQPEWLTKKKPERKTQAQRNKMKRRKEAETLRKHEAKMKAKEHQVERVKALIKSNKERERLALEQAGQVAVVEDSDDGDDVELRRVQPFSKHRIPEAPLEVLLMEDLPDSLRKLKPEGNMLTDRYRSLLVRGKVEARRQQPKKGRDKKYTEKWSYKDWKLQ